MKYLLLSCLCLLGVCTQASARMSLPSQTIPPSLQTLNKQVLENYSQARQQLLPTLEPFILVLGSKMILFNEGKQQEVVIIPDTFTKLKIFAHIPLGLYAFYATRNDAAVFTKLQDFRQSIIAVSNNINQLGLTQAQIKRQQHIIKLSLTLINKTISDKTFNKDDFQQYFNQVKPLFAVNVREASAAQIDTMQREMNQWRKQLSKQQWQRLIVFVAGGKMPRKQSLVVQFFSHLLNTRVGGWRLVYAEGVKTKTQLLQVLGTYYLDTQLSEMVFHNKLRMHRDLLADAAKAKLKPREESSVDVKQ